MSYAAAARLAARQVLHARGEAVARAVFYVLLLLVFSRLWIVMERSVAIDAASFLWYLAITEWITLAVPMLFLGFEQDVRRGDIAYRIARPVSYLWMKLGEGLGESLARLGLLAVVGVGFASLFAGGLPADPRGLLLALPLGVLAVALYVLFMAAIGLSTFWVQDASPLYWIVQKLIFVFGGLLFPLEIYPDWLRNVALWTPFQPVIHGCGRMALAYDPRLALETAGKLCFWIAVFSVLVTWLYRKGLRVLDVNGG